MAGFSTILIPTKDITASRELYKDLLGVAPAVDNEYYIGFQVGEQHIGLVPGTERVLPHLDVPDLDAACDKVRGAGGAVIDEPKAVGGGRRVAVVEDASGARIGMFEDAR